MTENKAIDEGNMLIAEFMELYHAGDTYPYREPNKTWAAFGHGFYHSSWDWFIPAFYKFRNLKLSVVDEGFNDKYSRHLEAISTAIIHYNIEKAHERFVTALQWYNQNKKP